MVPRAAMVGLLAVGLVAGCDNTHLSDVDPIMQLGIDRIEYGAVPVGSSTSRTVIVQNAGPGGLVISGAIAQDPDHAFAITAIDAVIDPGRQGEVEVSFGPPDVARYEGVLILTSNDPLRPRSEVLLGGDGYRRGAIEVDPLVVDFGTVDGGQVALGQVAIRNVGNGALTITGIALDENTHPDYRIQSSTRTPADILAGQQVDLMLAYRPGLGSAPPGEGRLIIQAADPYQPTTTVRLLAGLNQAPLADAGPDQEVEPLDAVVLDGGASRDPDGDVPLAYAWRLVRRPEGSEAALTDADQVQAGFQPDLVGVYEVELYVTDATGLRSLLPDRATITALPAERLLVELVWDSSIADFDLHLLAPGGSLGGLLDCHWGNPAPDWGLAGDTADDPALKRDDLAGFGPEVIGYNEPINGVYQLVVIFFAAHTPSGQEPTKATLRVFVDGFLEAELTHAFNAQGESWEAAQIRWPEGTVHQQVPGSPGP